VFAQRVDRELGAVTKARDVDGVVHGWDEKYAIGDFVREAVAGNSLKNRK
jgi:hypothetical protein